MQSGALSDHTIDQSPQIPSPRVIKPVYTSPRVLCARDKLLADEFEGVVPTDVPVVVGDTEPDLVEFPVAPLVFPPPLPGAPNERGILDQVAP